MKRTVELCDLCFADSEIVLAVGKYITDEKQAYYACGEHLEQCAGFGFVIVPFNHPGNCEPS